MATMQKNITIEPKTMMEWIGRNPNANFSAWVRTKMTEEKNKYDSLNKEQLEQQKEHYLNEASLLSAMIAEASIKEQIKKEEEEKKKKALDDRAKVVLEVKPVKDSRSEELKNKLTTWFQSLPSEKRSAIIDEATWGEKKIFDIIESKYKEIIKDVEAEIEPKQIVEES